MRLEDLAALEAGLGEGVNFLSPSSAAATDGSPRLSALGRACARAIVRGKGLASMAGALANRDRCSLKMARSLVAIFARCMGEADEATLEETLPITRAAIYHWIECAPSEAASDDVVRECRAETIRDVRLLIRDAAKLLEAAPAALREAAAPPFSPDDVFELRVYAAIRFAEAGNLRQRLDGIMELANCMQHSVYGRPKKAAGRKRGAQWIESSSAVICIDSDDDGPGASAVESGSEGDALDEGDEGDEGDSPAQRQLIMGALQKRRVFSRVLERGAAHSEVLARLEAILVGFARFRDLAPGSARDVLEPAAERLLELTHDDALRRAAISALSRLIEHLELETMHTLRASIASLPRRDIHAETIGLLRDLEVSIASREGDAAMDVDVGGGDDEASLPPAPALLELATLAPGGAQDEAGAQLLGSVLESLGGLLAGSKDERKRPLVGALLGHVMDGVHRSREPQGVALRRALVCWYLCDEAFAGLDDIPRHPGIEDALGGWALLEGRLASCWLLALPWLLEAACADALSAAPTIPASVLKMLVARLFAVGKSLSQAYSVAGVGVEELCDSAFAAPLFEDDAATGDAIAAACCRCFLMLSESAAPRAAEMVGCLVSGVLMLLDNIEPCSPPHAAEADANLSFVDSLERAFFEHLHGERSPALPRSLLRGAEGPEAEAGGKRPLRVADLVVACLEELTEPEEKEVALMWDLVEEGQAGEALLRTAAMLCRLNLGRDLAAPENRALLRDFAKDILRRLDAAAGRPRAQLGVLRAAHTVVTAMLEDARRRGVALEEGMRHQLQTTGSAALPLTVILHGRKLTVHARAGWTVAALRRAIAREAPPPQRAPEQLIARGAKLDAPEATLGELGIQPGESVQTVPPRGEPKAEAEPAHLAADALAPVLCSAEAYAVLARAHANAFEGDAFPQRRALVRGLRDALPPDHAVVEAAAAALAGDGAPAALEAALAAEEPTTVAYALQGLLLVALRTMSARAAPEERAEDTKDSPGGAPEEALSAMLTAPPQPHMADASKAPAIADAPFPTTPSWALDSIVRTANAVVGALRRLAAAPPAGALHIAEAAAVAVKAIAALSVAAHAAHGAGARLAPLLVDGALLGAQIAFPAPGAGPGRAPGTAAAAAAGDAAGGGALAEELSFVLSGGRQRQQEERGAGAAPRAREVAELARARRTAPCGSRRASTRRAGAGRAPSGTRWAWPSRRRCSRRRRAPSGSRSRRALRTRRAAGTTRAAARRSLRCASRTSWPPCRRTCAAARRSRRRRGSRAPSRP